MHFFFLLRFCFFFIFCSSRTSSRLESFFLLLAVSPLCLILSDWPTRAVFCPLYSSESVFRQHPPLIFLAVSLRRCLFFQGYYPSRSPSTARSERSLDGVCFPLLSTSFSFAFLFVTTNATDNFGAKSDFRISVRLNFRCTCKHASSFSFSVRVFDDIVVAVLHKIRFSVRIAYFFEVRFYRFHLRYRPIFRGSWAYDVVFLPTHLERTVKLQKGALPLGIVLDGDRDKGVNGCVVKSICGKKAVALDGRIQVRDQNL